MRHLLIPSLGLAALAVLLWCTYDGAAWSICQARHSALACHQLLGE